MKYTHDVLMDFCKENNIKLCNDYSDIKLSRDTFIQGICITENCSGLFNKGFRALLKPNAYCYSCAFQLGKEKSKQTTLERYGVEFTTQVETIKDKIKITCLEKYGVDKIGKSVEIKNKTKLTCLEKYGVEVPSQCKEIKDKMKKTSLERYGVENYVQTSECKERTKKTSLEKYGFEYPIQSEEVKEKIKNTNMEKYGVTCNLHNKETQEKIKEMNMEKYGVANSNQREDVKEKKKETLLERYGVEHPNQSKEIMDKATKSSFRLKEFIFPSGRLEKVQGYEPYALNDIIYSEKIKEDDIILGVKYVPEIWYYDENNKKRRHYVDIFIESKNLCIEVKSTWTVGKKQDNIFLKQESGKKLGYKYEIWVYNNKGIRVEKYE